MHIIQCKIRTQKQLKVKVKVYLIVLRLPCVPIMSNEKKWSNNIYVGGEGVMERPGFKSHVYTFYMSMMFIYTVVLNMRGMSHHNTVPICVEFVHALFHQPRKIWTTQLMTHDVISYMPAWWAMSHVLTFGIVFLELEKLRNWFW